MLKLQMYQGGIDAVPDDLPAALADLGDDYHPVLEDGVRAQAAALGLRREALSARVEPDRYTDVLTNFADVLATPEGLIAVEVTSQRVRTVVQRRITSSEGADAAFRFTLYGIGTGDIAPLLTQVAAVLSSRYGFVLAPYRYRSRRFEELLQKGMSTTSAPATTEAAGAQLLADPAVRRGALAIATSGGGLLVGDLTKQFAPADQGRADDIKRALEAAGLISTELVVICTRNASQVLRAPSRAALERMSDSGAKCACGRALLDERVENAVDLSELGRELLNGRRWMSLLLTQALHSLGIAYDSVVIEQKNNGEEMDCLADISGELCLFELKDKEFSLGNAYSFGAKVGTYQPPHAIIVTTAHVGNDAKEHFHRSQSAGRGERFAADAPSAISYIEGLESLPVELERLIESIYVGDARRALGQCLPFATLSASSVVDALRASHPASAAMTMQ